MNFRGAFSNSQERDFRMTAMWVPVTPEKTTSLSQVDKQANVVRGANWLVPANRNADMQDQLNYNTAVPNLNPVYQAIQNGGQSNYTRNVDDSHILNPVVMQQMLHYTNQAQNLESFGHPIQAREHSNSNGGLTLKSKIINHIAGSFSQALMADDTRLNNNPLEFLLMNDGVHSGYPSNESVMPATSRQLNCHEINSPKDYYSNNLSLDSQYHLGMDQPYNSLEGLVSSGISLNGSLFSMENQCSFSNPGSSSEIVSEIPQYQYLRPFETRYNPNFPRTDTVAGSRTPDLIQMENVAASSITNSIQMASAALNQTMLLSEGLNYESTVGQHQQKNLYEDLILLKENETHKYRNELLLNIADSSTSILSTPQKGEAQERMCYGTENHQGFDLNQTPEKKAPKRKKHRPKVIVEGKPKKARKTETTRREVNENTPKRRKYVRKSGPKESNPQADFTNGRATAPTIHCRRSLNFDSEEAIHQSQNDAVSQTETQRISDKDSTDLVSKYMEFCSGENIKVATNQDFQSNQNNGLLIKGQQAQTSGQTTQIFYENLIGESLLVGQAVAATTEKLLIQNSPQSDRMLNKETDNRCENRGKNCVQVQKNTSAQETGNPGQIQTVIQKHPTKEVMAQNNRMPVGNILPTAYGGMNNEKEYHHTNYKYVPAVNTLNTSFLHQEIIEVDDNDKTFNKNLSRSIEKIEKGFHTDICGIKSWQATEGSSNIVQKGTSDSNAEEFEMLRCYHERNRDANNKTAITEKPPSAKNPRSIRQKVHSPGVHLSKGPTLAIQDPSGRDTIVAKKDILINNRRSKAKKEEAYCAQIDELIFRLENLNLDIQNAIVPYKGDRSIVPFEGSDLVKKHKLRAKVALDEETERVWKMLMTSEGSDGLEATDEEKDKWWEEERRVLQGRANSFIARMHLVQGDRRFSPWKGSVVDSIVGVFLTQNVSDHLSSSAFMSLAARFPCKSRACNNLHTNIVSKEPEVCLEDVDSTVTSCRTMSRQMTCNETFVRTNCTLEHWKDEILGNVIGILSPRNPSTEEEILSSQDSHDSSIIQGSIEIRSSTGSNSDIEDPITEPKPDNTSTATNIRHVDKTTMFHEFYSSVSGHSIFEDRTNSRQRQHVEYIGENVIPNSRESLSCYSTLNHRNHLDGFQTPVSLPSDYLFSLVDLGESTLHRFEASGFYDACNTDYRSSGISGVGGAVDEITWQENGNLGSQPQLMVDKYGYSAEHFHPRGISRVRQAISPGAIHKDHQQCERIMDRYSESASAAENVRNSQIPRRSKTVNRENFTPNSWCIEDRVASNERTIVTSEQNNMDRRMVEQKSKEQVHSDLRTYEQRDVKVLKVKKAKADREKNTADWDNLRKVVEAEGIKQERSEDAMDSMDYEAVRHAYVDEIANAIKERGMNNMLAERIKEFLNRVVRDHGSIDLEWLRHVPPDKAKDYLLSIRGLGLKSVECVRLLTLHNVAFPVDTNVGRIAVRLGWVPLRPLPESLQIHLLELYPMLESVQKYLWPRLCKLDQKTLYELHYQLITFGKVFCTKSKPNCNACPMRAECRHFASAFASARLALPAPEERSIVRSDIPSAPAGNPRINMKVMSLPAYENNLSIETYSQIGNCEPIIEEPATPEQDFAEILHSDIEDVYPEDPDEIPTIKLSIEDFATNLQNYMQENTELQDCDLSKALVALSPEVASIHAPKLKHVSRLRTEHQVYELHDSHPLLEKMDRREPDDPSPYLLAIWGPGETANTIEPPERTCNSPDSNLCNETTCSYCNSIREANSQTVRGTILIPCRTAMRGSFPLNGTYFQVNEVFADHESSHNPIDVPRGWLWSLAKRTVFFGTSASTIFKGLSTQDIQQCFWRGFVCVRGFDPKSRAPRPLVRRLHNPASKLAKR